MNFGAENRIVPGSGKTHDILYTYHEYAGAILKKTSVSGVAAGWLKKVRWGLFFIFPKMDNIFLPKKKKAASLLA